MLRHALKQGPAALIARLFSGLLPLAAALLAAPAAHAQAVPSNTGAITVLADGLQNPTTVAVKNDIAFVPEGQLARLGALGGLFQARPISLQGAGVLADKALRSLLPGNDFFPEGIAVDPVTNDMFVGSIFNGTIVKFPDGKREQQFTGRVGSGHRGRHAWCPGPEGG